MLPIPADGKKAKCCKEVMRVDSSKGRKQQRSWIPDDPGPDRLGECNAAGQRSNMCGAIPRAQTVSNKQEHGGKAAVGV
jgi:hypothetical protein